MEHIAFETHRDPADIRMMHLADNGAMKELFKGFLDKNEYRSRRVKIDEYNEMNRWCKRGIGLTIVDYPVKYKGQFMATVTIYHSDGTVMISHSGIEMGQGIEWWQPSQQKKIVI